jgi:nicotinamide mononucleotide adenylyltransferase
LRLAAAKYGRLYIGITGQERDRTGDLAREAAGRNPLAFWERVEMWRIALDEVAPDADHVVGPFPIEHPATLLDYVPLSCICATTIREDWNDEKVRRLEGLGYDVDILLDDRTKRISGEQVRGLIASGSSDWRHFVPSGVADYLTEIGLRDRLRALSVVDRGVD